MKSNTLCNVSDPVNPQDVATKIYVDSGLDTLRERVNEINERKYKPIIAAHASYHGDLIKGDYQFTFGGSSLKTYKKHNMYNGFFDAHTVDVLNVLY